MLMHFYKNKSINGRKYVLYNACPAITSIFLSVISVCLIFYFSRAQLCCEGTESQDFETVILHLHHQRTLSFTVQLPLSRRRHVEREKRL